MNFACLPHVGILVTRSACWPHFGTLVTIMREAANGNWREQRAINNDALRLVLFHLHDWVIVFALFVLDRLLAALHPFHRFVGEFMLNDLRYPHKKNTVPFFALPIVAILAPFLIFLAIFMKKKDIRDLHHATLGLLFSVMLSVTITDAVKDFVGRPRPDFFWRCFPDGQQVFNNSTGEVICHGNPQGIKEGHKSFPSGHTAWSFSGLGFLSLYLAGKIKVFDRRGHIAKLIIVLSPLAVASFIGLSRLNDYKHHWQDVLGGALLALTMATLCYRQFFPAPNHDNCMQPYAITPVSEESSLGPGSTQNLRNRSIPTFMSSTGVGGGRINHASGGSMGP